MPQAFFLPLNHPALRFEGRCLSCGDATHETVLLSGGVRGDDALSWAQPLPLCAGCEAVGARRHRLRSWISAGCWGLGGALGVGVALGLLLGAGWRAWSAGAAGLPAALLGGLLLRAASAAWLEPALWRRLQVGGVPLSRYREVELFCFREPRKGADARFICLRLEDDDAAAAFARLNPEAMSLEAWEASY